MGVVFKYSFTIMLAKVLVQPITMSWTKFLAFQNFTVTSQLLFPFAMIVSNLMVADIVEPEIKKH